MGTTTEKLTYLQGTKDAIKNAIVAKGVAVPEGTTFRGYAEKVGEIPAGAKTAKVNFEGYNPRGERDDSYFLNLNNYGDNVVNFIDKNNEIIKGGVQLQLEYEVPINTMMFIIVPTVNDSVDAIGAEVIRVDKYEPFAAMEIAIITGDCTIKYYSG